ncbi:MAG: site-2 protease family protein [Candidatus Pacearchaeota archaeon]
MVINKFVILDLAFLILFLIWVFFFLYKRKDHLKKEGILTLYKTQLGVKFIDYVGKKYKKTLNVLQYLSIFVGFLLMIVILFLLGLTLYTYIRFPEITDTVKAPPILPLIPYFPTIFGLEAFFPQIYFVYWIVAILIVAVAHEVSHGIFARFHNVRIKSTGFAFMTWFPLLFGAFVEQDDKQMLKKGKIAQMSILSAGVFANIIVTAIFFLLLWFLFSLSFIPSGILIQGYPLGDIPISEIKKINGVDFNDQFLNMNESEVIEIETSQNKFILSYENYLSQINLIEQDKSLNYIRAYYDAPMVRNKIYGAITKIDGIPIRSYEDLSETLLSYKPGDVILIEIVNQNGTQIYNLSLAEHPINKGAAFLGVYHKSSYQVSGFRKFLSNVLFFKDPSVYYVESSKYHVFFYYLVWWITTINLLVALVNMLPFGILDGGRFFQLAILGLTKSDKSTKYVYKIIFYIILLIIILLMIIWLRSFL